MRWSHSIITPATIEVISLAEAKDELDVTFNDDDALIMRHLLAAQQFVEGYTNRFLAPTVVEMALETFPARLTIPFGPVQSSPAPTIQYYDAGVLVPFTDFGPVFGDRMELAPTYGARWPFVRSGHGAVRVRFTAGYLDGQCPEALKQAVMVALRAYYEAPDPQSLQAQLDAARTVAAAYKLAYL